MLRFLLGWNNQRALRRATWRRNTIRWLWGLALLLAWGARPALAQSCDWTPLGSGTNSNVAALTVFDDGVSSALFVEGFFARAGGEPASSIAAWVCAMP
jgi:hypothetical protein